MADYMENVSVIVIDRHNKNYGCSRLYLADKKYCEPSYPWDWPMADDTEVHVQHISVSMNPTALSMPFGNLKQYWIDLKQVVEEALRSG